MKLVYYGPGLAGKSSNLQYIYARTDPERRGKMVSVATETERTLSFDFVPATLRSKDGTAIRLELWTVPGSVFYDVSREKILEDVDGIVFVVDSQRERGEANAEILEQLETNLARRAITLRTLPFVLQYNKQDLPNAQSTRELDVQLNRFGVPSFAASAHSGMGVFDTLKAVATAVMARVA